MLRLGVSLPALMRLLGHKDIRMTLRYVQVTQQDLQREFRLARQNAVQLHHIPQLPLPQTTLSLRADPSTIRGAISATRHLLELFRLQLEDDNARRKLRRLTQRLFNIGRELEYDQCRAICRWSWNEWTQRKLCGLHWIINRLARREVGGPHKNWEVLRPITALVRLDAVAP